MSKIRSIVGVLAAALAVGSAAGPAIAQDVRVPESRTEISLSFAPLVKKAAPAVVNIYTKRVVQTRQVSPLFNDPFFRRFFGDQFSFGERPGSRVQNSLGSGVIVRSDGLIVTNSHVIDKADEITVVLSDRREFEAEVALRDGKTDLAVLRIDTGGEELPFLRLHDSDALEVGDLVLAIGNPFGVGQTVTSGIVSALARPARGVSDYSFFIQTDAAINPGNSGGALIALDGSLVGINTAIYSRGGGSNGIGFAIPSSMVATVVGSAVAGGKVVRPWLGATGQSVDADMAASLRLPRPSGVLVNSVHDGGPAKEAGLKIGDVILSVNEHDVPDVNALRFRMATLRVGDSARLGIVRRGRPSVLDIALIPAPEVPPRNVTLIDGQNPYAGAEVANLSPALAEELSLSTDQTGVIVLRVKRGSTADRVGLEPGDILRQLNGEPIGSVTSLQDLLRREAAGWRIEILRKGRPLQMVIRG
ncbi:MAG: DegQ family serine endoprotease [Rhodospirillaceae bacterium]